jgi:GntR family transcriptional regulator
MPVDPNSHVPIYEQIVDHIRGLIAAGAYRRHEPLPSIRALALDLLVNPNTVQRAYQELERQGMVTMRKGRGVFVAKDGEAHAQRKSEGAVYNRFSQGIVLGQSANLPSERIRGLFDKAMTCERRKPEVESADSSRSIPEPTEDS